MQNKVRLLYLSYSTPKPNLPQSSFIYNRIKELFRQNIFIIPITFTNLYSSFLTKKSFYQILKNWGKNYNFKDINFDINFRCN